MPHYDPFGSVNTTCDGQEYQPKNVNRNLQESAIERTRSECYSPGLRTCTESTGFSVGIPMKVNGNSSVKPNGVSGKANSHRSEATLADSGRLEKLRAGLNLKL